MAKSRKGQAPECNLCECGDHSWAPLTKGSVTIVSPEDSHLLKRRHWYAAVSAGKRLRRQRYAKAHLRFSDHDVALHNVINPSPDGMVTDHKNGNTLDNRRSNLRVASHNDNMRNSKGHKSSRNPKGVVLVNDRFFARITVNGKSIHLGTFEDQVSAAHAYNKAAILHHGEFARLNQIRSVSES
jgi:hypothetical protein